MGSRFISNGQDWEQTSWNRPKVLFLRITKVLRKIYTLYVLLKIVFHISYLKCNAFFFNSVMLLKLPLLMTQVTHSGKSDVVTGKVKASHRESCRQLGGHIRQLVARCRKGQEREGTEATSYTRGRGEERDFLFDRDKMLDLLVPFHETISFICSAAKYVSVCFSA